MNRDLARETIKGMLGDYLRSRGIDVGPAGRKKFNCLNPDHNDKTPSMAYYQNTGKVFCYSCKTSYDIFDLIGLDYNLLDYDTQFRKAAELYNIEVDGSNWHRTTAREDFSDMNEQHKGVQPSRPAAVDSDRDLTSACLAAHDALLSNSYELEHYTRRGLSLETIKAYKLGFAVGGHNSLLSEYPEIQSKSRKAGMYRYIFPFIEDDGRILYFQSEITDRTQVDDYNGKYRKLNNIPAPILNERYLRRNNPPDVIFLTEGPYDALSVEDVGGKAIALIGAGGDTRFINCMKKYKPDTTFIFYMDKDGAGTGYCDRITKALPEMRHIIRWPKNGKDANDELVADRESFAESVNQMIAEAQDLRRSAAEEEKRAEDERREKYLNSSAAGYLQNFIDGISASVDTEAIPTGIANLDNVLDGGLYEGLITVGGISSVGKTSLIMEIADSVAAGGDDVLIFSLEMARSELMAKSISRHTLEICLSERINTKNAKTARGIAAGRRYQNYSRQEIEIIQRAITKYGEYADHLYITEGVGDVTIERIRDTVRQHILFTGGSVTIDEDTGKETVIGGHRPLVIVDYLQIIAPYDDRATDKQNTDKAVLELKRISRDYKLPVVAISSFNRTNYKNEVAFESFKESGAIEYSSDIAIGVQLEGTGTKDFDATVEKKRNPRKIELVILKNRQGPVGDKISLNYYPMFNYFTDFTF